MRGERSMLNKIDKIESNCSRKRTEVTRKGPVQSNDLPGLLEPVSNYICVDRWLLQAFVPALMRGNLDFFQCFCIVLPPIYPLSSPPPPPLPPANTYNLHFKLLLLATVASVFVLEVFSICPVALPSGTSAYFNLLFSIFAFGLGPEVLKFEGTHEAF